MAKIPELLTTAEAAAIRRTSRAHLANERSRGLGPKYIRDGGKVLYDAAELRRYLAERIIDPQARKAG